MRHFLLLTPASKHSRRGQATGNSDAFRAANGFSNCFPTTLAIVAVMVSAGCTGTGSLVNNIPWRNSDPLPVSTNTETGTETKKTAETVSREKPASSESAGTDQVGELALAPAESSIPASDDSTTSDEAAASQAENEPSENGLDAATLMLMNDYLSQVPFQERQQLYQEWKSLDGKEIRRRIAQRESQTSAANTDAHPESATVADSNAPAEMTFTGEAQSGKSFPDANVTPAVFEVQPDTPEPQVNRPVPLMEGLISEETQSPPESKPAGAAHWDKQMRALLAAAQSRAETAHALYLAGKTQSSGSEDTEVRALRRNYIASQVDLRLLYLMNGERGRALQTIPDIPVADQEFWRGMLWSIASYFDVDSMPRRSDRITQTVERLRTAINKLQGEANLKLRNVAFCQKITSFGNFERFENDTYDAGQKVLLYAEIINFKSVPRTSDGLFETRLKSTIEILREGEGQPLQRIEFEPTVDLCRSYRQDYFHSYELKLPADLASGPYVLKLTIEDVQSGDVAVYSLNFTVE